MKLSNLAIGVSVVFVVEASFGYQLKCINDYSSVDGGLQQVVLRIDKDGRSTASFLEESASPAASYKEETKLHELTCENNTQTGFLSIDCKGPFDLQVSERDVAGSSPEQPLSRWVFITTNFMDKSFSFYRKVVAGGTKSFCEVDETTGGSSATAKTKTTKTGHVFTHDTSDPKLGEAWRDPSGMIWGDIVKKEDGTSHFMNHMVATQYCKSIGAELPSREDFVRLREYMGAKSGSNEGYTPQVLPNLSDALDGTTNSLYFWSSSVHHDHSNFAYDFHGRRGDIKYGYRIEDGFFSVRCVVRR